MMEPTLPRNKKILIVTYYWPPSGGSGVQRWLKFVKYLHRAGWEPIVLTPENPSFGIQDTSLIKDVPAAVEVLKLPIWEPYQLFESLSKIFGGKKPGQMDMIQAGKKSLFQKWSGWIRGNLFIPDARVFWVRPATTFLQELIRSNQIETVVTTGPPHSMHLIGLGLKKKMPGVKWIADFRDPWSEWDLFDTLSLSPWARKRHQYLERKVLQTADRVITIAPFHVDRLQKLSQRKVELITNGFDEDDFNDIVHERTSLFTLRHVGVVDELRDPRPLMEAIRNVAAREDKMNRFRIEFIGHVNSAFKEWVFKDVMLAQVTHFIPYMAHEDLIKTYGTTDVQLLVLAHTAIAPGNLPGKIFEYLASGNPILAVGPSKGDAADVLLETKAGIIFERGDIVGMEKFILNHFNSWKAGVKHDRSGALRYSRRALTQQLIRVVESM